MLLADAGTSPLWANSALFALGAALVWLAGTRLARYAAAIADLTGLDQAFAGMLLLGCLTSLPEAANVVTSSYLGNPALAVNNLLGSASINIVLLAVADAAFAGGPVINALGRFEVISALLGVLLTGIYLVGLLEHRDRVVLRMGYDSLAVLALFVGGVALLFAIR